MIRLTDRIYVGNSFDGCNPSGVDAVLNVAYDLYPVLWDFGGIEYAQVGLLDGPGNELSGYCAAVLALASLLKRYKRVLVCCHDGDSRSVAVVVMYLMVKGGKGSDPGLCGRWKTWSSVLSELRAAVNVPEPHPAHRAAADKLPLGILERLL